MIQFTHLPVEPLRVTSPYGKRNTGIKNASTFHHGIDLGRDFSKSETQIFAVAKGTIKYNGWHKYRGWYVVIQHNGFQTLYQHMKAQCSIKIGTAIKSGAIIGLMGNSSDTSVLKIPMHLHFAVCQDFSKPTENGRGYADPLPYLKNIKLEQQEEEEMIYATFKDLPKWYQEGVGYYIKNGDLNDGTPLDGQIDPNYKINLAESTARALQIQYNTFKRLKLI